MAETSIKNCNCKSKFQDETYGVGKRVHNRAGPKDSPKWRCTVCSKEQGSSTSKK